MQLIEFVRSKDGNWVPVFEGRALHSTVNPIVEAERLVQPEISRLTGAKTVIVLGLGGGFHIEEIARAVPGRIIVIEAEREMAFALQGKKPVLFEMHAVIAGQSPSTLLLDDDLLSALGGSFVFFRHPASIRQRPDYYKSVVRLFTTRTPAHFKKITGGNPELHAFFNSLELPENDPLTLPALEEAIRRRGQTFDDASMIWLALRELVK